jgi:regulator of extracellular matrix RemA (YlzA/DUF370 family)
MVKGDSDNSSDGLLRNRVKPKEVLADPKFINVGYGNLVVSDRVVAVIAPNSAPMKRLKDDARENGRLIDATHGRRTRSIIVTDSKHVILSAVGIETISQRFFANKEAKSG